MKKCIVFCRSVCDWISTKKYLAWKHWITPKADKEEMIGSRAPCYTTISNCLRSQWNGSINSKMTYRRRYCCKWRNKSVRISSGRMLGKSSRKAASSSIPARHCNTFLCRKREIVELTTKKKPKIRKFNEWKSGGGKKIVHQRRETNLVWILLLVATNARTKFTVFPEVVVQPGTRQILLADIQRVSTCR